MEHHDTHGDWWTSALANGSRRHAPPWADTMDRDFIAGTVVGRGVTGPGRFYKEGVPFIVLRVDGGVEGGKEITPGDWRKVFCSRAGLAEMLREDDPQPGDKVAVSFEGTDLLPGLKRHRYRSVVERVEHEPGVASSPW